MPEVQSTTLPVAPDTDPVTNWSEAYADPEKDCTVILSAWSANEIVAGIPKSLSWVVLAAFGCEIKPIFLKSLATVNSPDSSF